MRVGIYHFGMSCAVALCLKKAPLQMRFDERRRPGGQAMDPFQTMFDQREVREQALKRRVHSHEEGSRFRTLPDKIQKDQS
jgi:hypothetical protein